MKKFLLLSGCALAVFANANAQTKNCLIEQFTSSTCPPCASFNSWWDPMLEENKANQEGSGIVVIKYQENFPNNTPLDYSFNPDVNTRDGYYYSGSWGIPTHRKNGKLGTGSQTSMQGELDACKGGTADLEITGSYIVKSLSATEDSLLISITVTPKKAMSGNYSLRVAATEKFYTNPDATTSQSDYHHAMRKMFPNATGTAISSFTANTPQTFTFAYKSTIKTPHPTFNKNEWWGNPLNGHIIAFVQDNADADKMVLNSKAIAAKWHTNVPTMSNIEQARIVPNPASDKAAVVFNLAKGTSVSAVVTDMMGRVVLTQPAQEFGSGANRIILNTDALANGNYIVRLESELGNLTERMTVSK